MAQKTPSRGWRICKRCFRALRIALVLFLFFLVAAGVYLNEVGLPGFIKRPLLEKLHARGLDLEFARLRWHWNRGFVAENVHAGSARDASSPQLSLHEVELKFSNADLLKFLFTVDSVILHDGNLVVPVNETNEPPRLLAMTNIQSQLRFLPGDEWALDHFSANFAGAKVQLSGSVSNASTLREWKLFRPGTGAQPGGARKQLRDFSDALNRIHFTKAPEMIVTFNGDARDPDSFNALVTLKAQDAQTPWANLTNGLLIARLSAPNETNRHMRVDTQLQAEAAGTPWASARNFQLALHAVRDDNNTNLVRATLEISAFHAITEWAKTDQLNVTTKWTHSLTNPIPQDGATELRLTNIQTRWGSLGELRLNARMTTPAKTGLAQSNDQWDWWSKLEPYALDWNCLLKDIHSVEVAAANAEKFELKELACGGRWRAPELTVSNLNLELYGGKFSAEAKLNVASRAASFNLASDFELKKLTAFLSEAAQKWTQQISWDAPPALHCEGGLILPSWTNSHPDWTGEVLPTLWLQGIAKLNHTAFRELSVTSLNTSFSLIDQVWTLPDFALIRPEGGIELGLEAYDDSGNFHFTFHSGIDPKIVLPLVPAETQKAMNEIKFTEPPKLQGEVWGNWHDWDRIGFTAKASVTNFIFRGETATYFRGDFAYTNEFLNLFNGRVENGARYMTATGVGVDIAANKLYLTNGFSIMEPMPVAHAISKKVTKTIEPYQFLQPPTVHAYGVIPLVGEVDADLHFQVDGGPFHWQLFNVEHLSGEVHWVGDHMTVTNAKASFYKGNLAGSATFDFSVNPGTDFSLNTTFTNTDLYALIADLMPKTNHLQGRLSGHLNITRANTDDWHSWNGNGDISLSAGLIWEIPIFGVFSPVLDKVNYGLGESRISDGAGKFTITNSVIYSDTLEIRSRAVRLLYHGKVDFDGKVDSIMEALVFHETPLVGPLLSTALTPFSKFFESKVTGTLQDPKIEQRYFLPKLLLMPFHPFKSLKEMFPSNSGANTPPQEIPASETPPAISPTPKSP